MTGQSRMAVLGSVDGLVMFMGIVFGILVSHHGGSAAWHAALGGGTGELVGMTAGIHESEPSAGWGKALICGAAGAVACVLPAVPFLFWSQWAALWAAMGISVALGAVIAWLRPEHGWRAIADTYLVLFAAAILSGLSGLI